MTAAVALADLEVRRGAAPVVRGLSAEFAAGGWFGIVGANGSGKTTLLRAVAGRLPIASGSCRIAGRELAADRAARAERIGFAPPIERLPAGLSLRALLALASGDVDEPRARCAALWDALEVAALLDRPIGECSSGMRQRAAIALAFATPCAVAILDEPFNWLDPVAAFDVRAALGEMVRGGLTLVTALHDLATLCGACDAGMILSGGRATLSLTREELREGQGDARAFEARMIAALRRSAQGDAAAG